MLKTGYAAFLTAAMIFLPLSCAKTNRTITVSLPHNVDISDCALLGDTGGLPAGGGVVTHHLLASPMIAAFYSSLAGHLDANVSTIVLIGPDHINSAVNYIALTSSDWVCDRGIVKADRGAIRRLLRKASVATDELIFLYEHSIRSQIPFIAEYLPGKKIIPLVIRSDAPPGVLKQCAAELASVKNAVFVLSMDFSHYKDEAQTLHEDEQSLRWLEKAPYYDRRGAHLDCEGGAAMLVDILTQLGYTTRNVLAHATSFDYGAAGTEGTGYYILLYQKQRASIDSFR